VQIAAEGAINATDFSSAQASLNPFEPGRPIKNFLPSIGVQYRNE
jgi:hypothetical protein